MKHLLQHSFKRTIRLALALAACWLMFASPCRAQVNLDCCQTPGDANGDDSVNLADITFLIARIFSGGEVPHCRKEADANGSGKVNISDVTFLISRIFAGGQPPECAVTPPPDPFPNDLGNWWRYERIDSLTMKTDTVMAEIINTATQRNGQLVMCWRYTSPDSVVLNYVNIRQGNPEDTVKVYDGLNFIFPSMAYHYPLADSTEWENLQNPDSICLYSFTSGPFESLTTPAGVFDSVLPVLRARDSENCFFDGLSFDSRKAWLFNQVGIVRFRRVIGGIIGLPISRVVWSLLDFDVTPRCDTCN